MEKSISVRMPKKELKEINTLSEYEGSTMASLLREIVSIGIKNKKIDIAFEKFQKNEVTAAKASSIAGVPLSDFLDILKERGINFHYGVEELREDFERVMKYDK